MKFIDPNNFSFPKTEEKVLKFWKESKAFKRSVDLRDPKKPFVFYEGPPTANGKPGIHHILARSFKDVICRFKTMQGFRVERKAGWDTHGLPVELEVEKELGLKTKKDIEKYGIEAFNKKCKESVWKYKEEWENLTQRMGFWIDMDDPYVTYQTPYIESLWHIIKQFWQKDLLFKGHKVVPWCTRCGTALSSHEMAQGYKTVGDRSVFVKFKVTKGQAIGDWTSDDNTYILAWTTTPWTLPGNVALAVGEKLSYTRFDHNGETYIFATDLLESLQERAGLEGTVQGEEKGKALIGLTYEPLFEVKDLENEHAYKVYGADFVTTEDGTGVVHTAVMYGEDDYQLGTKVGLPKYHTVSEGGTFTENIPVVAGMRAKDNNTDEKIFEHLKEKGYFLAEEKYKHEYPHCWRCSTPLLYYARESWFVGMSQLRDKLLKNNQSINWIPNHIQKGRFGGWLEEVKDWNFSRARYWGTPLPVWQCEKCDQTEVIGSREELAQKVGPAKNTYLAMRHGLAQSNLSEVAGAGSGEKEIVYHETATGLMQAGITAEKIKKEYGSVDMILASDLARTQETAQAVADVLGIDRQDIITEKRIREINVGIFDNNPVQQYRDYYTTHLEKFTKRPPEGESLTDVRIRTMDLLRELEEKHAGKTILMVSHEYPMWAMYGGALGLSDEETANLKMPKTEQTDGESDDVVTYAELLPIEYRLLPRDETGTINLHRPFIDEITFDCEKCEGTMTRIEELADVWFDSGSMPFAQSHFPFGEHKKGETNKEQKLKDITYPADYIAEAIDQTRGWFYTLLAVATALGHKAPYKNVICHGHILDKKGEKMSKSKGNIVDPWEMMNKYGVDAIRWHFFTVNPPGEPIRFDEVELSKTLRKFFLTLYNTFVFYKTYAAHTVLDEKPSIEHPLDIWILARLQETIQGATEQLEAYEAGKSAKIVEEFVDDLSRWYVRRSRRRLQKSENEDDYRAASAVLHECLYTSVLLAAPFAPFMSEAFYQELKLSEEENDFSVHVAHWPEVRTKRVNKESIEAMARLRNYATEALKQRAEAGIKVRQPLAKLSIKEKKDALSQELLEILADEINVKEIVCDPKLEADMILDRDISLELKEEGTLREFIRVTQILRKDADYKTEDQVTVTLEVSEELQGILQKHQEAYQKEVGARQVIFTWHDQQEAQKVFKINGTEIKIGVHR